MERNINLERKRQQCGGETGVVVQSAEAEVVLPTDGEQWTRQPVRDTRRSVVDTLFKTRHSVQDTLFKTLHGVQDTLSLTP